MAFADGTFESMFSPDQSLLVVGTYGESYVYEGVTTGESREVQRLPRFKSIGFSGEAEVSVMGWWKEVERYSFCG